MSDDNILKGITGIKELKIEKREDPSEKERPQNFSQNKKDEKKKSQVDSPNLDIFISSDIYQIELGCLILKKRNVELNLFTHILKNFGEDGEDSDDKRAIKITQLKSLLYDINKEIENLDPGKIEISTDLKIEKQLVVLSKISLLYEKYLNLTLQESLVISDENYEDLEEIMEQKNRVFKEITTNQNLINLKNLEDQIEDPKKKSKVNQIVSDIKNMLQQVINQENQNSVNLKCQKQELMNLINKKDRNANSIHKYKNGLQTSHFISTKK